MGQNKPFRDKRTGIGYNAQIACDSIVQCNKHLEMLMRDKRHYLVPF